MCLDAALPLVANLVLPWWQPCIGAMRRAGRLLRGASCQTASRQCAWPSNMFRNLCMTCRGLCCRAQQACRREAALPASAPPSLIRAHHQLQQQQHLELEQQLHTPARPPSEGSMACRRHRHLARKGRWLQIFSALRKFLRALKVATLFMLTSLTGLLWLSVPTRARLSEGVPSAAHSVLW